MTTCRPCSIPMFLTTPSIFRSIRPFFQSSMCCTFSTSLHFFSSLRISPKTTLPLPTNPHIRNRHPTPFSPSLSYQAPTTPINLQQEQSNNDILTKEKTAIRTYTKSSSYRQILNILTQAHGRSNIEARADAELYRLAIRSLVRGGRIKYAKEAWDLRKERDCDFGIDVGLGVGVVRGLVSKKETEEGRLLLDELLDRCKNFMLSEECDNEGNELKWDKETAGNAIMGLGGVIVALLKVEEVELAERVLEVLFEMGLRMKMFVNVKMANDMIRLFGKKKRLEQVFTVIDGMKEGNVKLDNESFEFLANAVVRQVEFVTSAVSMDTLPDPVCPEVAFVGRSNVGKSSLINMLCNRKALAYTSQSPGKTQQFNYFIVNPTMKDSRFYLVDLPGVGYAKVPRDVQAQWLEFMVQYMEKRKNLAVVLHLIDGRHGIKLDDMDLMDLVGSGRCGAEYVVVLTKMDKLDKQKAKRSVVNEIREALARQGQLRDTPIVLSSATTKLGRDVLWRYFRMGLPTLRPRPTSEVT